VALAIGDEARAKYHEAVRHYGFSGHYQGLIGEQQFQKL